MPGCAWDCSWFTQRHGSSRVPAAATAGRTGLVEPLSQQCQLMLAYALLHPSSLAHSIYTHLGLYYGNSDGIKPTFYRWADACCKLWSWTMCFTCIQRVSMLGSKPACLPFAVGCMSHTGAQTVAAPSAPAARSCDTVMSCAPSWQLEGRHPQAACATHCYG